MDCGGCGSAVRGGGGEHEIDRRSLMMLANATFLPHNSKFPMKWSLPSSRLIFDLVGGGAKQSHGRRRDLR
jgi:hypothetical protein